MRTAFSTCPVTKDKLEMHPNKLQSCEEEGYAFLPAGSNPKHQIVYATTTQPKCQRSRGVCNAHLVCVFLFATVFACGLIGLEVYRSGEIFKLRQDMDTMRADFENLKHRIFEDDLLDEIRKFEEQSYHEDNAAAASSTTALPDEDATEDSEEDDPYDDYSYDDSYGDDDPSDADEPQEEDAENSTGSKRERRDVELQPPVRVVRRPLLLGRTEDGVPVLSHSYAAIKELNRTGGLSSLRLYDTLAKTDDSATTTEDPIKLHHRISPLWVPPNKKWKKSGERLGEKQESYHKRRSPTVTAAPWPVIQRHSRVMQTPEDGESVSTTFGKDHTGPAALQQQPHHAPHGEIVMRVIQPNSAEQQAPQARELHPPAYARTHAGAVLRSHDPSNPAGEFIKPRRERRRKHHRVGVRNQGARFEMDEDAGPVPGRLAAHFVANSSMYLMGHPHFAGNGRLRHPGVFTDWSPASWMRDIGMDHHFVLSDGVLTVRQPGLYFFYAQIYYIDDHDNNGYNVYVNDAVRIQCTTMTHSSSAVTKMNTCYTASNVMLSAGDTIYLRDITGLRYSLFEPDKSFFGLFRLGHARIR